MALAMHRPCIESSSTMYLGPSERSMMELLAKLSIIKPLSIIAKSSVVHL